MVESTRKRADARSAQARARPGAAKRATGAGPRAGKASGQRPPARSTSARTRSDAQVLTAHLKRAVSGLEPGVRAALVARPELVDEAIDVLAHRVEAEHRDTKRPGSGTRKTSSSSGSCRLGIPAAEPLSVADGEAWVEARTTRRPSGEDGDYAGAREVAELVGISRQAVQGRRMRGDMIGFFHGRRDALFPREQFDERGRVVPGIGGVLAVFDGDGWEAWSWLKRPCAALDGARPIDRLRDETVDEVVAAARGHRQGDFA